MFMKKYSILLFLVAVAIVIGGFVSYPEDKDKTQTTASAQPNSNEQGYSESNQDKW